MDIESLKSAFPDTFIAANHPLAPLTTVKIGGPADIFINVKTTEELINILKYLSEGNVSFRAQSSEVNTEGREHEKKSLPSEITILGNGSNVLISDSGIRGIVIKNSASSIKYLPNNQVKVSSGVRLSFLINDSIKHSLSGLEEFAYIPSTLGGAIVGNIHGVNKNNFDKFLVSVDVFNLNSSTIQDLKSTDLSWDYDSSEFQHHPEWIILSALLQLQPGNPDSPQTVTDIITKKTATQPMNSLGSVFKNPPNDSAGRIIDQELGLKGFRLNNVQVSPKHANFFLNLGHATALNYLTVIKKVQFEAKSKLNLDLELEIKFLGEF